MLSPVRKDDLMKIIGYFDNLRPDFLNIGDAASIFDHVDVKDLNTCDVDTLAGNLASILVLTHRFGVYIAVDDYIKNFLVLLRVDFILLDKLAFLSILDGVYEHKFLGAHCNILVVLVKD